MGFVDSMKDIAGKLGSSVEKGAKTVSESSKKFAEKTKVKREISQLENEINNSYIKIGKIYYDVISDDPSEEYAEAVSTIKTKSVRLEKFKKLLMSLEDKQNCSSCGAQVFKGQKFCDNCGAKLEEIVTPDIEGYNTNAKVCPKCGVPVSEDQIYCESCGEKIE